MSSNLYWQPVDDGYDLPDELKFKLREEYQLPVTMSHSDLPFLKGLIVCDINGAKDLFQAIEKHGEVRVYEKR